METSGPFTYVIVGAGSAGCVLANCLSADPRNKVALLEAGGHDNHIWVHIPVGYLYCMGNPRMDWLFKTEPEPGLNGRALNYPRGKLLGGCSAINGMIYMRGQAADYDHWRQLGLRGWGWDDVLPYFLKSEDNAGGADEIHNVGGEWRVEDQRLHWPILDAVRDACEEVGIPKVADFNRGNNLGSAYFKVNQRSGIRVTAAKAFLNPVRQRKNLTILTGAHVRNIIFEGRRAIGVRIEREGSHEVVKAEAEVILAAGAIGSPQILQLSGVGPAGLLGRFGIPIVCDAPNVGENLQDHLQLRLIYKLKNARTLNQRAGSLFGRALIGAEYVLRRTGPMSMAPSQLGIFAKSDSQFATPNLEYHVQPLSLDKFGEPLHDFPAITMSVCNLRPEARGFVRIKSGNPLDHPAIQPNYLSNDNGPAGGGRRDQAHPAHYSYKSSREVRARWNICPGSQFSREEELATAAGEIGTTIFHPVGTCRMGTDDHAVVDGG